MTPGLNWLGSPPHSPLTVLVLLAPLIHGELWGENEEMKKKKHTNLFIKGFIFRALKTRTPVACVDCIICHNRTYIFFYCICLKGWRESAGGCRYQIVAQLRFSSGSGYMLVKNRDQLLYVVSWLSHSISSLQNWGLTSQNRWLCRIILKIRSW